MSPLRTVALLLSALVMVGCAAPITLSRDFLTLAGHDGDADYRAVTGDDARVWVRRFRDPNAADLAFWAKALEHDFVQQRGYDLVDKGDVKNGDGEPGRWFECAANVRGNRVGYLIAVWVDGDEVLVVEFAAQSDVFAARVESVRKALRTVRG